MDTNPASTNSKEAGKRFWDISSVELLNMLNTKESGLTNEEAKKRLGIYGANGLEGEEITSSHRGNTFTILLSQFRNPLLVIFLFISGLYFLGPNTNFVDIKNRQQVIVFLDTRIRNTDVDPDI